MNPKPLPQVLSSDLPSSQYQYLSQLKKSKVTVRLSVISVTYA